MLYELDDVTKSYTKGSEEVRALANIDLTIEEGDYLALQGATGSGKSTLLQLLGAMDAPTSGVLRYDGTDINGLGEGDLCALRASAYGIIFQSFNLIPTLSAQENVETALVPLGTPAEERRERALQALHDVGLAARVGHLPAEMSGGEQQRVGIARALVRRPRVILADEPTGNLDERTRDEVVELLERFWRELGQTLIVVTHDSWVASRALRRIHLDAGMLKQ